MAKIIFLSPHLDDVVLSCATWIMRLKKAGHEIEILNIFNSGEPHEAYQERMNEDAEAIKILDIQASAFDLSDAPFREVIQRTKGQILFVTPDEDQESLRQVARLLALKLNENAYDWVYAPLGVGWHLDHLIVHEAAIQSFALSKLRFYAERPYSMVKHQTELRIKSQEFFIQEECAKDLVQAEYIRNYLPSWTLKKFIDLIREQPAPTARAFSPQEKIYPSSEELPHVLRAMSCYRSQITSLFGSMTNLKAQIGNWSEDYFAF